MTESALSVALSELTEAQAIIRDRARFRSIKPQQQVAERGLA